MNNSTTLPLVCTVLPTYNERANIGPLIDGLLAAPLPRIWCLWWTMGRRMVLPTWSATLRRG